MLGVLVNSVAVVIGSLIGLLFNKGVSKKFTDAIMLGIGLCTIYIGASGMLKGQDALVLILSIIAGAIVGTWLNIDKQITGLGEWISSRFKNDENSTAFIATGFVTGSLLFCIGAMTIVGSMNAGLTGNYEMLYTKSLLDLISSMILAVSLGIGVLFSAVFVFLFQGAIVILAQYLQPVLTNTAIAEITAAGSLLIVALGST
ncbi:MAG TPA: DUF554 domain-containing protein [Firmicutes bacterium]|nr:DUF554 domain-containing protein [Bacillota bacterium]